MKRMVCVGVLALCGLSPLAGAAGMALGQPGAALATAKPAGPVTADVLVSVLEGAWAKCGRRMALTDSLSRAARDVLLGQAMNDAMKAQGFVALKTMMWTMSFNGKSDWVGQQMVQECGKLGDLNRYGLSTDGVNLVLITAREATVDLSQRERWLGDFLTLTNQARSQARVCGGKAMPAVGPVAWDNRLAAAAQRQVTDMITLNFRGHVNPSTGSEPWQRAEAAGFHGHGVGENLAYGMVTPRDAVQELLGSPKHCENLMDRHWTLFGAAVGNGSAQTLFPTYWAQVFGLP